MANLLPGLIDTAKSDPNALNTAPNQLTDTTNPFVDFYPCAQGQNGAQLTQQINNRTQLMSFNAAGFHFLIMDEVDNLTPAAQGLQSHHEQAQCDFYYDNKQLEPY